MARILNVGLIGFGMSGRTFHAPFLVTNSKYNLTTVVERTTRHGESFHAGIKTVRSVEELLSDPKIDMVVITTPNETHFPFAERAMRAGKHVVVEKPFTNNTTEAKELIAIATQQGVVLSIYQNRRYVSDFCTIQEILGKELLGELVYFETCYDRYRPEKKINAWREENRPGSGILFDLGSHLIDQALFLFGKPGNITATIRTQRHEITTDDYFDLRLDYGLLQVRVKASMLVREMGPRYMIHGRKGSFIKSGNDIQEDQLKAGQMPNSPGFGVEPESMRGILHTELDGKIIRETYPSHKGNYGAYYDDLHATIIKGEPLTVTPHQAHNTIRIIELAFESNNKSQTIESSGLI